MSRTPDDATKETSFEEHLEALEAVVADLEGDALPLEAAIERYRVGVTHLAACRKALDAAEKRLVELAATADGTGVVERALEVGPDGLLPTGREGPVPSTPRPRTSRPPPSAFPSDPLPSGGGDDLPF